MKDRQSNQRKFRKRLIESCRDVHAVASMYALYTDSDLILPSMRIGGSITGSNSQADDGDLRIRKSESDPWLVVEVKGYSYDIGTLSGFKTLIVDKVSTYDAKHHSPQFYFAVAQCRRWAMWHNHDKEKKFMTEMKYKDQVTGALEPCYILPIQYWRKIELCRDS